MERELQTEAFDIWKKVLKRQGRKEISLFGVRVHVNSFQPFVAVAVSIHTLDNDVGYLGAGCAKCRPPDVFNLRAGAMRALVRALTDVLNQIELESICAAR